mgnify:CR=1 FL=1
MQGFMRGLGMRIPVIPELRVHPSRVVRVLGLELGIGAVVAAAGRAMQGNKKQSKIVKSPRVRNR